MDLSFIDNYTPEYKNPDNPTLTVDTTQALISLIDVAKHIPLLKYNYNDVDVPDTGLKMGTITQAMLKVPGLASMVSTNNGIQGYDANMVAGACLGLIAELARIVLNVKLETDYGTGTAVSE